MNLKFKIKNKILIAFAVLIGMIAIQSEAKADVYYIPTIYISNGVTYLGITRIMTNRLGDYSFEFRGRNSAGSPICIVGHGWYPPPYYPIYVKPAIPEYQLSAMDISYNANLEIKSPIDVTCDIYELSSGKQVMKDINVQGNSAWHPVQIQTNSHHYLIQFKVGGAIVYQKTFLINNNQFYKGGQ